MPTLELQLPGRVCPITIEPGALERLGAITASVAPHAGALLAVDAKVADTHAPVAAASLAAAGYAVARATLVADETHKTVAAACAVIDEMLAATLERGSPVVALGGGIVGDVAGFAAATYLRGVPLVQAPTTLLAMVDAAIGGKTGVNFPRPTAAGGTRPGKNLVGAFWQPRAVVADPLVLRTLDPRDYRCGLAECVKHAIIADAALLAFLETHADALLAVDVERVTELVARSAAVKVRIVEQDEREAGVRALLNLGHTFAHAIEPIAALDLRHGEAVAIGLCAAARCAAGGGRLSARDADRIVAIVERLGLPVRLPRPEPVADLLDAMRYDKKVAGGIVRLVLPTALGAAVVADDVPATAIEAAWRAVGAA